MSQVVNYTVKASFLRRSRSDVSERIKESLFANPSTTLSIFKMSKVFDYSRVINLWPTCIDLGARFIHLKVSSLIVTGEHAGGCAVEVFSFVLANYLISCSSVIYNLELRSLRGIPVWPNPQLIKHDFSTWTLLRAQICALHLNICVVQCNSILSVLQPRPPLECLPAVVLQQRGPCVPRIYQIQPA